MLCLGSKFQDFQDQYCHRYRSYTIFELPPLSFEVGKFPSKIKGKLEVWNVIFCEQMLAEAFTNGRSWEIPRANTITTQSNSLWELISTYWTHFVQQNGDLLENWTFCVLLGVAHFSGETEQPKKFTISLKSHL